MGIRTDMAVEAAFDLRGSSGIRLDETRSGKALISRVHIDTEEGAALVGKPCGTYITIESPGICGRTASERDAFAESAGAELRAMIASVTNAAEPSALIIGLGNKEMTADSLGPLTAGKVFVTRHIREHLPGMIDHRAATVAAVAPGVLGVTGLETSEVVRGIVADIKPDVVIAVDALASGKTERIAASLQLSDAGISPGSGIGNHRRGLTRETLGVPVIAMGMPMVVYAGTIAADLLSSVLGDAADEAGDVVDAIMGAEGGELVVTPKNIDELSERAADIIAAALDIALHPELTREEIAEYMSV